MSLADLVDYKTVPGFKEYYSDMFKSVEIVLGFVIFLVMLLMAIAMFPLMAANRDSCALCDISDSLQ